MVQLARSYYDDEEMGLRRYSRHAGHGFALGHERELPHGRYEGHSGRDHLSASHHESRGGSHAPDPDNTRPRSRIPVACGRCRKRKIRCSGDAGTGQPCASCKSAGHENCQFLRVSSQGMQMKNESIDFSAFDTASAPARLQTHMLPYRPHTTAYHQPYQQLIPEGYYAGRTSISGYQYPTSRYYGLSAFNDNYEDTIVDYGVPSVNNPYQLMGSEHLLSSSLPSSYGKWSIPSVQAPQLVKNNSSASLYSEHDSNYHTHNHLSYQSAYQLRPTNSPEDVKNPSIIHSSLGSSSLANSSLNHSSLNHSSLNHSTLGNSSLSNSSLNHSSLGNPSLGNSSLANSSLGNSLLGNSSLGNSSLARQSVNSMPAPDRVLPVPPTNYSSIVTPNYSYMRTSSTAGQQSTQNQSQNRSQSQSQSQSQNQNQNHWHGFDGLMGAAHTLSSVKSLPQNDSSYLYNSSPESLSSSQSSAYSSQNLSSSQSDLNTTSSENSFHGNDSTESSSYGPSSMAKRSNQANASESISSMNSTLANGHQYIPFPTQASYPAPPMLSMAAPTPTRRLANLPVGISAS